MFGVLRVPYTEDIYYTLEDSEKIIPAGEYDLSLHDSPTHKKVLVRLNDVLQNGVWRTYILIHGGNTIKDTLGCILAGRCIDISKLKISVCDKVIRGLVASVKMKRLTNLHIYDCY